MATGLIAFFSVLTTSTLSGIFGMGGGMILMGVFAMTLPLATAMILHGVTQLGANSFRAFLFRRSIRWHVVAGVGFGAIAALAVFALLQVSVDVDAVFIILGGLPVLVLLLPPSIDLTVERGWQSVVCGSLFGGLQLIAGASGPILDAFFLRGTLDRFEIVATKAAISSIGHILKLLYWGLLLKSAEAANIAPWVFVLCVVTAFLGTRLGKMVLARLGEVRFHRYSRVLIMAIAAVYLGRGFFG